MERLQAMAAAQSPNESRAEFLRFFTPSLWDLDKPTAWDVAAFELPTESFFPAFSTGIMICREGLMTKIKCMQLFS